MVHGIYPIEQRGVWYAVHGQQEQQQLESGAITKPWLDSTRNWFMQQLMSACGIAAHDVLTDEEVGGQ